MTDVVVITTEPLDEVPASIRSNLRDARTRFLDLSSSGDRCALPDDWDHFEWETSDQGDGFRVDFLNFLESWPNQALFDGHTFEELFQRPGGYSIWWTSVGAMRTPGSRWVRQLRMLWRLDDAFKNAELPERVVIHTESSEFAVTLGNRCRAAGLEPEFSQAKPGRPFDTRSVITFKWLVASLGRLAVAPARFMPYALAIRAMTIRPPRPRRERAKPAIIFRPHLSRLVRVQDGAVRVAFWDRFLDEVRSTTGVRTIFILRPKLGEGGRWSMLRWLRETGRSLLRTWSDAEPPSERYAALFWWLCAVPAQVRSLFRFYGLRRSEALSRSLSFAGADISHLVVPSLQKAIEDIAEWEREVGFLAISYGKAGNVQALFALAEFYPGSMKGIEAAQRLGIAVVGAQHGTIYPHHYVYAVPKGHVDRAPVPDFFAAYGEYATEIVSEFGSFPRERVWEVGAPRMDALVGQNVSISDARTRLGLPSDAKIILVATHTYRSFPWFREVVKSTLKIAANHEDVLVCIKPHPGDMASMDVYRSQAEEVGNSSVRFFDDQFDELLAACDVLVSGSSTTIIEATLLGKQTICANFSGDADIYPYVEDGASLPAHSDAELQDSLEQIFSGQKLEEREERRREFLRRHLGPTADGAAAAELTRNVMALVNRDAAVR